MQINRKKHGRGFTYVYPDGERLDPTKKNDKELKAWITSLAIPPAWTEVDINLDRSAKIHVVGRDGNGKKQYIYNSDWVNKRNQEKFARIQRFAEQLETMRRVTGQDLRGLTEQRKPNRKQVLACMVRLLDTAYFRPGNSQYTKENDTYGLTTLRSKHLSIDGDELTFEYNGKAGVEQVKQVEDARLAAIIAELDELPGYRIFKYYDEQGRHFVNSDDLNSYIREIMGEDYSAKDFRTWAGTAMMAVALAELDVSDDETERNKNIVDAIARVAERLGNTPAICKQNYIDARVIDAYIDGTTINHIKRNLNQLDSEFLSQDELAVVKLLESRL